MAATVAQLVAKLTVDDRDFKRGMHSSERSMGSLAKKAALAAGAGGAFRYDLDGSV